MFLIFDTETTGLPKNYNASFKDTKNWPRVIQLAWQIHDKAGNLVENHDYIIKPEGFTIPFNSQKIHGISTEMAEEQGEDLQKVLTLFEQSLQKSEIVAGHNIKGYDIPIMLCEYYRKEMDNSLSHKNVLDTQLISTEYCQIPGGRGGRFKFPKLTELYQKLFDEAFDEAHNAAADVNANSRAFLELIRLGVISEDKTLLSHEEIKAFKENFSEGVPPFEIKIRVQVNAQKGNLTMSPDEIEVSTDDYHPDYFNFHVHSTYSILQSTIQLENLVEKAIHEKMPAVGFTDFGNLMGAFQFLNTTERANQSKAEEDNFTPIIPVVGMEIHISKDYLQHKFTKEKPDVRYPQVLLAKNLEGFKNLSKISSIGNTQGYYAGHARVSKEILTQYKNHLIATTGSMYSEIPYLILNVGETQAEEALLWYKETFGDDFYIELQNHLTEEEQILNTVLLQFAQKHDIKILPQNECFYLDKQEAELQDILQCIKDGEKINTPIGKGFDRRFGLKNQEYYFKNSSEIKALFPEVKDLFKYCKEFREKFEPYTLKRDILLPAFEIPENFKDPRDEEDKGKRGENKYLRHLTFEGAKKRYETITPEIEERLNFELETIEKTGYPGYFLIVQDITNTAKDLGVTVGPGRGSAAGSAVAYCTGITNIDPIRYDLLFERFLNPDRISMPDIDIDFDDKGRESIIRWVIDKYGQNQVAQIITYGTLAGRSAIRDTGRVLELPLSETDQLAKKFPSTFKLKKMKKPDNELQKDLNRDDFENVAYLKSIQSKGELAGKVLNHATKIEGSIRNTGIHACGVIITPEDISNLVPVTKAKDSDFWVSQFDNNVVEDAGLLKMDFLGLKTLSIINDALDIIELKTGERPDPNTFPLDDPLTYERVFKPANTVGIFQFESPGMQKHLRALQPDKFEDLIAMNALYRPGPMQYIPQFIARKHGREEIAYDLEAMEEILQDTYGITVYQEQVMLLSQKLSDFSKGEADSLRKAMGKKKKSELDKMFPKFIENGLKNGHAEEKLRKIWKDWEAFAEYAFNKSHATCYSDIAFKTAYIKAHYPSEYMAALLSNNLNNLKTLSFFMEEARKMDIEVLGPSVNESQYKFFVNQEGNIRFGLGAIKGIGKHSVDAIVEERKKGNFEDIWNFAERIDLKNVNKKTMEGLALSGAFDELDTYSRATYFNTDGNGYSFIENLLQYGNSFQNNEEQMKNSLFGALENSFEVRKPEVHAIEEWNELHKLKQEKEVVGIYISSHPLDEYKHEIKVLRPKELSDISENQEQFVGQEIVVCGMITRVDRRISKDGRSEYAIFDLEDYSGTHTFTLRKEYFDKYSFLLEPNKFVFLKMNVIQFNDQSRSFIQVRQVELLKNVLDKYTDKLSISLSIEELDDAMIKDLTLLKENYTAEKGGNSKKVKFIIFDPLKNEELELSSLTLMLNINKQLLDELDENEHFSYVLN